MIEHKDGKTILHTPINKDDISSLNTGDIIYITGTIMTGRDSVHVRVVKSGLDFPLSLKDGVIFHAGPIAKENKDGSYSLVAAGPTTSMRMEDMEAPFIEKTGVRVIIGKGGMGKKTAAACSEYGAIHCVFPSGCAVIASERIKEVKAHYWDELTMSEMVWVLDTELFGPLVVSIDSRGNNLFEEKKSVINEKAIEAKKNLYSSVKEILNQR